MTTKDLNCRQVCWAERLADFKFHIEYRSGTENGQADALSRRDDVYPLEGGSSSAANNPHNHRQFFQPHHLRLAETTPYDADFLIERLREAQLRDEAISKLKLEIVPNSGFSIRNNLLHQNDRIVVPDNDNLKLNILRSRHNHRLAGHPGQTKTLQLVSRNFVWKGIQDYVVKYVAGYYQCLQTKTPRHKK